MFIEVSDNLKKLSKSFPEGLFIVGGYVRNQILKIENSDVDLASEVDIEEVCKRLEKTQFKAKVKNLKMGSLLISIGDESYEYTAFRKETYEEGCGHCPVSVQRTNKIEEDIVRRDFSINALYYNINKDEIIDFDHGIVDLSQSLVRCVYSSEDVLKNDGERILRMVRIAGELDFKIEKQTMKSAIKYAQNVADLSGSRKLLEIEKILYCDKRYNLNKGSLKRALKLLNKIGVWQYFGLKSKEIKYDMVYKVQERALGLLIDIVDTEKPECLETFLEVFLKEQFGLNQKQANKVYVYLSGYYNALDGMNNKDYFFKYFDVWPYIYLLLKEKSKHVVNKYSFFYQYIIEHGLIIRVNDLTVDANKIREVFPNIDKRQCTRILNNLLSKVFDGKLKNNQEDLLKEIEEKLQNY